MNLSIKNKSSNQEPSFFSTNLSPKNQTQNLSFDQDFDNDPTYYLATQIKRKISKPLKKPTRESRQLNYSFVSSYNKKSQTKFQSIDNPYNRTTFASKSKIIERQKPSNISNTIDDERKLLSKITIHRIRSQRQHIESETKRIQNSYNYLFHKLQKDKRKSLQVAQKKYKIKQIHQTSKLLKEHLKQQKNLLLEQNSLQKSRLRQSVLKQKKNKQKSLINFYSNLHKNASQVRFESQLIDEQILKTELSQIQNKKIKYQSEKQKQKRRLLNRQKSFQNKRLMAQTQFKQRWLKQFSQNTKARRTYLTKKQVLNKKMQQLYDQVRIQQKWMFEQVESQKAHIKMQYRLNPQERIFNH